MHCVMPILQHRWKQFLLLTTCFRKKFPGFSTELDNLSNIRHP
ncbi:hypothetical protein TPY_1413 [Sulfobacillus acidophilus TPY]|nr:hypothetical protein TPY_1413 [Sulfobacillus acidophilus TPY]